MVNFADSLIRGIELLMIGTSFGTTIFLLLKAIGQIDALDELMPELPASAYLMREEKKVQRIRHKKP